MSAIAEILTVGHSTHQLEAFLGLLGGARVEALADVRRFPGSRRTPWFGAAELGPALEGAGVRYVHLPELGGRREGAGPFQGYADHMASDEFALGLERLEALGRDRRTAAMCAEAQWRRCHRRLLSDALVARGWDVLHLDAAGGTERHPLSLDV